MSRRRRLDQIYEYIIEYKTEHGGNSPTIREICDATGITSTSLVNGYLDTLADEGKIVLPDALNQPRSIKVVGAAWLPPKKARELHVYEEM